MILDKSFETRPIGDIQIIKGISFPAKIKFTQLLVTGPPGSGKSSLIQKIGGWPEEGYVDLGLKRWWASRVLSLRPREVHLGIPFVGYSKSLSIVDQEWEKAVKLLQLDYLKIQIPEKQKFFLFQDWRNKYVFEFVLPDAKRLFEERLLRAKRKTHRVDECFDMSLIIRQLDTLWAIAMFLHHHGLNVYVREGYDGELIGFQGSGLIN